ncbi:HNH endonuclease signature motif containing protein, partial [Williamsia sp. CHRR-6]|uniref:HNH endonuclease n=1 Tax=Williamsia sp. CHRR-6 TaxID=2835871 RepID=UPI001BD9BDA1
AEDSSLNQFTYTPGEDGRLHGHFDLDILTGERLIAGLDAGSRPRPLPDGTPDPRTAQQRRADAFGQLLESGVKAMASTAFAGPTKTDVLVTIPATTTPAATTAAAVIGDPSDIVTVDSAAAHLHWLGPISTLSTTLLTCDAVTSVLTYDEHGAPVTITDPQRLFSGPQRTAVTTRDHGCIKCGAPSSWGDIHHIIHHADGGRTIVDNGCVLCRACHVDVHHRGWDVIMGHDRHPWLRPPASIDPHQTLMPSYHRR